MTDLVLTLIGPDRPGLVEAVAGIVAEHGGNWLESRMTHLAGKFAGILRAQLPPERAAAALQALAPREGRGAQLHPKVRVRPTRPAPARDHARDFRGARPARLALHNPQHPLRRRVHALA